MSLQNATPSVLAFTCLNRPRCPDCGDVQLVPERSEFAGDSVVRHAWWCEACGSEFETEIEFSK